MGELGLWFPRFGGRSELSFLLPADRRRTPMRKFTQILIAVLTASAMVFVQPGSLWAAEDQELELHYFNGTDGGNSYTGLIFDAAGNLYGTTEWGGNVKACQDGCGTIFRLTPSNGQWTYTVLYELGGPSSPEGSLPTGLFFDTAGTLYGTASGGGQSGSAGQFFKLTPTTHGPWNLTVLFGFGTGQGYGTNGGWFFGADGNLYGSTSHGGANDNGAVFRLTPTAKGPWKYTKLYQFGRAAGGQIPVGGMVFDAAGNLYGVTYQGGTHHGVVFELSPASSGLWTETVIHTFGGRAESDGANPLSGLIIDSQGNLYGTTGGGGKEGLGTVYELSPDGNGQWTDNILVDFAGGNGAGPVGGLILDGSGDLYGTTASGGVKNCEIGPCGTVFELSPSNGQWTETVLHKFAGGRQGLDPWAGVVADANGNLYGTSLFGGKNSGYCLSGGGDTCGVAFEIVKGSSASDRR
jgi:uncharacterized repeat protein (TIGR03803 family)